MDEFDARSMLLKLRARGHSQQWLVQMTGISQSTLSKLETGKISDIMGRNFQRLQATFNADMVRPVRRKRAPQVTQ